MIYTYCCRYTTCGKLPSRKYRYRTCCVFDMIWYVPFRTTICCCLLYFVHTIMFYMVMWKSQIRTCIFLEITNYTRSYVSYLRVQSTDRLYLNTRKAGRNLQENKNIGNHYVHWYWCGKCTAAQAVPPSLLLTWYLVVQWGSRFKRRACETFLGYLKRGFVLNRNGCYMQFFVLCPCQIICPLLNQYILLLNTALSAHNY